jgi:RNA polymerase sigma-70 factor (ECF subfamily)
MMATIMQTEDERLAGEIAELRPRLLGIAYRILGSAWDAEDVVAEATVRWLGIDRAEVREPLAFLTTVVTRLAIDQLRSARSRRERYTGEWLPEPVLTSGSSSAASALDPLDTVERRETVSLAALRMMETLSPPERAVLVLHDAFELPHAEIAGILGISEVGARQHLFRARHRIDRGRERSAEPAAPPTSAGSAGSAGPATDRADRPDPHDACFDRFLAALERGDLAGVRDHLAADVVAYSDGGGKAKAARRPIVGPERVLRFYGGLVRRLPVGEVRIVELNGRRAALLRIGRQHLALAVDVDPASGRIREIDSVLNPDKLAYLHRQLATGGVTAGD